MPNADHSTAAEVLRIIITRGQAAYQATLPAYDMALVADVEPAETTPNITLTDEQQRALCLNCSLPDCLTIASPQCPIRIEQRRVWRAKRQPTKETPNGLLAAS